MKSSVNKIAGVILLLAVYFLPGIAQNTRINDYNTIGWYTNTTTLAFSKSFSGHFEFQWRRDGDYPLQAFSGTPGVSNGKPKRQDRPI